MSSLIDISYPLHWPEGWFREPFMRRAPFSQDRRLVEARSFTLAELHKLKAKSIVISCNVRFGPSGLPKSAQVPQDRGVAVYFELDRLPKVLACDRWVRVEDNLYAIGKHVAAVRAQERYGVGTMEQAFRGYAALPPKEQWWQVLGVSPDASRDEVDKAYQAQALHAHPDRGGSADAMARLNAARDESRVCKGKSFRPATVELED